METSFFSGSENLYKYLVSIGLVLVVLTIYYPLKEKQDLQISRINLETEALLVNAEIQETKNVVDNIKSRAKSANIENDVGIKLDEVSVLLKKCRISQIKLEQKLEEIKIKKNHIRLYNILFWVFFPVGVIIIIYGFIRWLKIKKIDDEILNLEKKKLHFEVDKLQSDEG